MNLLRRALSADAFGPSCLDGAPERLVQQYVLIVPESLHIPNIGVALS